MSGTQVAAWVGRELSGGRYRVDAQLGEGGMGVVYRAWDKNLSTEVVIKVPHASMLQDAEFAARFAREISSLVKLSHPHIVKISDVGEQDRLPFAVMQFLPGGSLEDRQKSGSGDDVNPLPPDTLKTWLPSIADALDFVHSQGYIHRDVKPANILFDAHGHAYLSDFGIAKSAATGPSAASNKTLTGSGMVIGTPEYMAPELIMGQTCDGRVDQYALAVTVFEILAGRRPFEDSTATAIYVQHATKEPPDLTSLNPNVSAAIAAAIRRALSKSPDQRFASCRAFATVLLGAVETFIASQPEAVDTKCPVCQSSLKLTERMRGKQLRCAGCHSMLHVSDDLRQLSELKSDKSSRTGGSGTRAIDVRGGMPEVAQGSDSTFRLAGDRGAAVVATQSEPASASVPVAQKTMAVGQPSSRTKRIQSPASVKKDRPEKPKASHAAKPKVADQEPPASNKKWFSIAVGGAAIVVLLGITIFVMTSRGTVKITIKGGDDSVQVKVDGDEIAITGLDESLKLSAGEHGLTVTSPRFETVTKSFKVTRGDTTVVEVELQATPLSAPAKPADSVADNLKLDPSPTPPKSSSAEEPRPEFTNNIGMSFKLIPAGEFMMGSSDADVQTYLKADADVKAKYATKPVFKAKYATKPVFKAEYAKDEQPQHRVKITQPFFMATHEVTQAQYEQIMGTNPSWFSVSGRGKSDVSGQTTSRFPVEYVSWFDAVEFCIKLSEKESRMPCYRLTSIERSNGSVKSASVAILNGDGYRLPTEAEWEYACRAKSTTPFHFGTRLNGEEANVNGNYPFGTTTKGPYKVRTTTVGSYSANAFGLYDMHGNVWEWCQDGYDENYYAQRVERDPQGPTTSSETRVVRGGSWVNFAWECRSDGRGRLTPGGSAGHFGFRVVATSSPPKPSSALVQPAITKSEPRETVQSAKSANDSDKLISRSTGMEFALIPAGEFMMGSSDADVRAALQADSTLKEEELKREQPQHPVRITKPFYMGVYEVIQGEFQKVLGRNTSEFSPSGSEEGYRQRVSGLNTSRFPVENVTWFDAIEFCNKLSEADGRTPNYRLTGIERNADQSVMKATVTINLGTGYRLPTEAEWEYACRGNTTTPFHFGSVLNGDKANVNGNLPFGTMTKGTYLERTTAVDDATYPKNAFGLAQMHGNVWEWCEDVSDGSAYAGRSQTTPKSDPLVTSGSEYRVLRGGSWYHDSRGARSAYRLRFTPDNRYSSVGFRVVCLSLP